MVPGRSQKPLCTHSRQDPADLRNILAADVEMGAGPQALGIRIMNPHAATLERCGQLTGIAQCEIDLKKDQIGLHSRRR